MSKKPIPFRSPKQQASIRKAVETRARRRQLLELTKKEPSFERWTAADLEKIFWDVWDWVRAIPKNHPNAPLVFDLEARVKAEYMRRHQKNPHQIWDRRAAEALGRLIGRGGTAERPPPSLRLVTNDDEPDPAS